MTILVLSIVVIAVNTVLLLTVLSRSVRTLEGFTHRVLEAQGHLILDNASALRDTVNGVSASIGNAVQTALAPPVVPVTAANTEAAVLEALNTYMAPGLSADSYTVDDADPTDALIRSDRPMVDIVSSADLSPFGIDGLTPESFGVPPLDSFPTTV